MPALDWVGRDFTGRSTIAIEFSQLQRQIADKLQSEFADQATDGGLGSSQIEPTGDGAARFQAYMEGSDGSAIAELHESSGPAPISDVQQPTAEVTASMTPIQMEATNTSMTLGDRILANMSSFQPQMVAPQEINQATPVNIMNQSAAVDPMQALDWQMQTISVRGEVGLSSTTSENTEQNVESLLKSQS